MALGKNIKYLIDERHINVNKLSELSGVDTKSIYAIISRDSKKSAHAPAIARALDVSYEELLSDDIRSFYVSEEPPQIYRVQTSDDANLSEYKEITRLAAEGSCGGGRFNYDVEIKKPLIKEVSFFTKYQLKPDNAVAIYADGDSMSDYIVDGDIVIFDKSKTTPISGKIFLIRHPDGLKIKELRKNLDGSITLSSRNLNKTLFPDELITKENLNLLEIYGQFVYRQGG